jgi:hypothetical protein
MRTQIPRGDRTHLVQTRLIDWESVAVPGVNPLQAEKLVNGYPAHNSEHFNYLLVEIDDRELQACLVSHHGHGRSSDIAGADAAHVAGVRLLVDRILDRCHVRKVDLSLSGQVRFFMPDYLGTRVWHKWTTNGRTL